MRSGDFRRVISDFFGLGAVKSPKGDWKRGAKKNPRPDFGAWVEVPQSMPRSMPQAGMTSRSEMR